MNAGTVIGAAAVGYFGYWASKREKASPLLTFVGTVSGALLGGYLFGDLFHQPTAAAAPLPAPPIGNTAPPGTVPYQLGSGGQSASIRQDGHLGVYAPASGGSIQSATFNGQDAGVAPGTYFEIGGMTPGLYNLIVQWVDAQGVGHATTIDLTVTPQTGIV